MQSERSQIFLKLVEFQECQLFFALLKNSLLVQIKIESKLIKSWTKLLLFKQSYIMAMEADKWGFGLLKDGL